MSIYHRIRDLREDSDKTQTDIAVHLGTTAQYYGKYEKGEREIPFSRAIEIADYYNVSLDYIANRTNEKNSTRELSLTADEIRLIEQYRVLSERNKGKADLFIEQLREGQSGENEKSNTAKNE